MRFFRQLAIVAAFGSLAGTPSFANAATFSYLSYYEDQQYQSCPVTNPSPGSGVLGCYVLFSNIPPGRTVSVTHVSCNFFIADYQSPEPGVPVTDPKVERIYLTKSVPVHPGRLQALPFETLGGTQPGTDYYSINAEVELLFGPGQRPIINMTFTEQAEFAFSSCVLTGSIS